MRWLLKRTNDEYLSYVSRRLKISKTIAQILINRGVKEPERMALFLRPSLSRMEDPLNLSGISDACEHISYALKNNHRILIHGDYDADGLSGTAMLVHALRKMGGDIHYFIPRRDRDGYGFNEIGVKRAKEIGAKLIVTVDCGIRSFDAVRSAVSHGISVVITDHHTPLYLKDEVPSDNPRCILPQDCVVVNPKIRNPHSELSGAGVVFKLLWVLSGFEDIREYLDLVTIGTIGDIVPLIDENRNIISEGLEVLRNTPRPGLLALYREAGVSGVEFTPNNLTFTLIPRINAPGRMDDASQVVDLFITTSDSEAQDIARNLNRLNSIRQSIEEDIYGEALELFKEKYDDIPYVIVLAKEGWHPGVVGIIASKFEEEFYRPAVILSITEGVARGSVRSIPEVDILEVLTYVERYLLRYGGHKRAAGLMLREENLEEFERKVSSIVSTIFREKSLAPQLYIDSEVLFKDLNFSLIDELRLLEPFGYGNPEPVLGAKNVEVTLPRIVGNGHLKLRGRQDGREFDIVGFGMAERLKDVMAGVIDIAFLPRLNEFNGIKSIQLKIKEIRRSSVGDV